MASDDARFPTLLAASNDDPSAAKPPSVKRRKAPRSLATPKTEKSVSPLAQNNQNIEEIFSPLAQISGFIAAAIVSVQSGNALATLRSKEPFDINAAAAANAHVVKAKHKAMEAMNLDDSEFIEDILITLKSQYHLIRLSKNDPSFFLYLALTKDQANLAMARHSLSTVEHNLVLS